MTLWIKRSGTGAMAHGQVNADEMPCPTIMAGGLGGGCRSQYWLEEDGRMMTVLQVDKPPYRVPSMKEIAQVPENGLKVASCFSGAGGSCLGYRMAGFNVVWANEFVPIAAQCYRANFPDTILDGRDVREVEAAEILAATGLAVGELDLLDGSPPCQAFSTAGKREKGWGKLKRYEHGAEQCNETLFTEYTRLVRGLMPKTFVAENVSGLVKGVAKGYFLEILRDLKACGYVVKPQLLDAQWLGVPQVRKRIIFQGVREDLGMVPAFPKPLSYRYSVRDALPWIAGRDAAGNRAFEPVFADTGQVVCPTIMSQNARTSGLVMMDGLVAHSGYRKGLRTLDGPYQTIHSAGATAHMSGLIQADHVRRKFTLAELRRICGFPDDFVLTGSYVQGWARLGNSVPPVMMAAIASTIRDEVLLHDKAVPVAP